MWKFYPHLVAKNGVFFHAFSLVMYGTENGFVMS